jgi:cell division septal protein FtsQ
MKKFYKIFLLIFVFIFLSTINNNNFNLKKKNKNYFNIQNIVVSNNTLIEKSLIIKELNSLYKKNIFLLKKRDVLKPLLKIDYLDRVEVKINYPDTIDIKVIETIPVAMMVKENNKYVLDNLSNLIFFDERIIQYNLPSIFGKNADKNFILFLNQLKKQKFPINKIKNYYYFQIGRWDLEFINNNKIKLPKNNIELAIKKSIKLLNNEDFKNYKIIDLRVDGKIIVEQ